MEEIWKPILEFDGAYEASNLGRIRSKPRKVYVNNRPQRNIYGKILSPFHCDGYLKTKICINQKEHRRSVHSLVALALRDTTFITSMATSAITDLPIWSTN